MALPAVVVLAHLLPLCAAAAAGAGRDLLQAKQDFFGGRTIQVCWGHCWTSPWLCLRAAMRQAACPCAKPSARAVQVCTAPAVMHQFPTVWIARRTSTAG